VIVAFNGEPVSNIHELHKMLMAEQIGVETKIVIVRHTEKLELSIFPAESRSPD
jgi:S1-C subfamily serine protease